MSTSHSRRRINVYDFTSLRVRPDGTRVLPPTEPSASASGSTQYRSKHSGTTFKDASGNWIAYDAGGTARIPKRRKVRDDTSEEEGEEHGENGHGEDEEAGSADGSGDLKREKGEDSGKKTNKKSKTRKKKPLNELKDNRSLKRRKFEQDMSFLDPTVAELQPELNLPPSVSFVFNCCALHDCGV
jgi:hypothetical protein